MIIHILQRPRTRKSVYPINDFIIFRPQEIDISNLYNIAKPGDITHEEVRLEYCNYFVKYNRRMKLFIDHESVQLVPCYVLQV